ncbi:MAG: HAMP domain-containing histidine kinase [Candidatus Eisenbacteria sp.]|nr:HAMP domain-containing histidine kinase [Candidatus Eisenbacteria bacterium]
MRAVPKGMGSTLFLAFSAAAIPVLLTVGLLLEWQARRALEVELARRLESLAAAVSSSIPPETWGLVFSLGPGEEGSRTAAHLRSRLERISLEIGAERIAVWTRDGRLILDTSLDLRIGSQAPRAALVERELEAVGRGERASTPLFRTESGRLLKIGLAPIEFLGGESSRAGVLLVEAPSQSLGAITNMRRTLWAAGAVGWVFVLAVAWWLSRRLTRRTKRLADAARRIGRGDLESTVPVLGEDELGILAEALDRMRKAVWIRERQLRAMLGGVAHEIRNPLGGLILSSEMLARDGRLPDDLARKAQRILEEGLRLERVVSDFLHYAKPERPHREQVQVEAVLMESARSAREGLQWQGECRIDTCSAVVSCDPDHLRQITLNLLRNAMQAVGTQGNVWASTRHMAKGLEIRIEDSGPGVSREDRERIFEAFYSGKAEGAGLGLAIVRRLCDLNGVDIEIADSKLGGASFRLGFHDDLEESTS